MLFNSWQFLLFFPVVTTLYFLLPHKARWLLLLLASCVFYCAFIPKYLLILLFTIGVDYVAGRLIAGAEGTRRKHWLWLSLAANLGILGFFKYFNFANENLSAIASFLHWNYSMQALAFALPIGLSFHVFQSMSYTIEVYRGHQAPMTHLGKFALYVMFYPQLVAGPIERPQNLLHQFEEPHRFDPERVASGLKRMAWGLFKKVVVADRLALYFVGPVFADPGHYEGLTLAVAAVAFAFQIYGDFSGYSDIALGSAEVMGFKLMENFKRPYASRSITEFWTRWHISLSSWFRDYLYIPLGGNRVGPLRWAFNIGLVFLLSGLWHGAHWTFLIWGALHGLFVIGEGATASLRTALARVTGLNRRPRLQATLGVAFTFSLVTLAWVFFRAKTLAGALTFLGGLGHGWGAQLASTEAFAAALSPLPTSLPQLAIGVVAIAFMETGQWLGRTSGGRERLLAHPVPVRWLAYQALILTVLLFGVYKSQSFIYFQF